MFRNVLKFSVLCLALAHCAHPELHLELGADASSLQEPEFQWPVAGAIVTQKFRPHRAPSRRRHQGIDLAAPANSPISAIDNGIVIYAGQGFSGYGRLVIIEHPPYGYQSYYAHLSRFEVQKGDLVQKGELVGLMGRSGRATGVHLHFEIRKDNVVLNPLDFLPTTMMARETAAP